MKRLLFIFLFIPIVGFSQYTAIPDQNFEQALIDLGHDDVMDGQVLTASISSLAYLDVASKNISDLTGIEDFSNLFYLRCEINKLTSLDLRQNNNLIELYCYDNQLTSLDLSENTNLNFLDCHRNQIMSLDLNQNTELEILGCWDNQLTNVDVSNNTALTHLDFSENQLTTIDVSNNTALLSFYCYKNQLTSLNIKNGNNSNHIYLYAYDNPNLTCIEVDDEDYSNTNWLNNSNFEFDDSHYFSNDCDYPTGTIDITNTISIYPNPANEFITINNGNYSTMTNYELRILNSLGQEVFSNLVVVPQFIVPVSTLGAEGTYFVQVLDGDGNLVVTKYLILN